MDGFARDLVEVTRLAVENLIREPAEKYDRAHGGRETDQKRETDELE